MSERLDEIKARAEAATEGPWTGNNGDGYGAYCVDNPTGRTVARCEYGPYEGSRDATFIAHARTDVPALVVAIEAVLALHSMEADGYGGWMCATCLDDERGFDPEREPYPCPTVTAIQSALGEEDE